MNKNGFTLVELLVTVIILAVISGIAIVSYTNAVEESRIKAFKTYENTMHAETISLFIERIELIPAIGQTKRFTLEDIGIEPFNNPKNKDDLCTDSYIDVTRTRVGNVDSFTYEVCLICPDSEYNVNGTSCKTYEN